MIDHVLQEKNWEIIDRLTLPGREGRFFHAHDLPLSEKATSFLGDSFPEGIYRHQKEAIKSFLAGENVCLTTGTASGKSLPFYVVALEKLAGNPKARVLVVYPLKALAREQEERWIQALAHAQVPARVGRIDGQTAMPACMDILRNCQVVIMTPDIMHAWLLFHMGDKAVISYLIRTSLVIVDEVHYYTGVFGSNAAYLFRRLRHIMRLLGVYPQFITASATIAAPDNHLRNLLGLDFTIIDSRCDTSPRHAVRINLANGTGSGYPLSDHGHPGRRALFGHELLSAHRPYRAAHPG